MIGIAAVVFSKDETQAHAAFKQVRELAHSGRIHLETATVGLHQEDGQFSMEEAEAWDSSSDSNWNRFWHRIVHRPDAHSHDTEFIKDLGDKINPGDAAVFVSFDLRYRPEILSELGRLGGVVVVNELSPEQKEVMLADIHADEMSAQNLAFKKKEKGELTDDAAEYGIQNIE